MAHHDQRPAALSSALIWSTVTSPRSPRTVLWVGDFTYLRCWEGKLYFSFVIDVFCRRIVGWQLASHMRTDLVLDALRMALGTRQPGADFTLVTHTDQGSQYTSYDYTQVIDDHRVLASVGSVGDAYDNAMAESFRGLVQNGADQRPVWQSRSQLELAILEYVDWFNNRRLHESLGDIPPVEFESSSTHAHQPPISGDPPVTAPLAEGLRAAYNAPPRDRRPRNRGPGPRSGRNRRRARGSKRLLGRTGSR